VNPQEAHETPRKPGEPVRMKDLKGGVSGVIPIRKPVETKESDAPEMPGDDERMAIATPFTQEQLVLLWDEFADSLRTTSPHLYSTLKGQRPVLMEDFRIEFGIDNKLLEDELNLRKTELMEFLRTKLNNFQIRLQTRIAESARDLKPYTDKEKFEKMAEKNPALRTLKEQLDLEIEY
jgi:DNA polymerase-3 subunit gamma/tau